MRRCVDARKHKDASARTGADDPLREDSQLMDTLLSMRVFARIVETGTRHMSRNRAASCSSAALAGKDVQIAAGFGLGGAGA
jgi:hypothetical protein